MEINGYKIAPGANLRGVYLCGADLSKADLYEANLRGARLRGAGLYGADLREADLRGADLREANLCGADLRGADLREANLCGADLREARLPHFQIPDGALIGWKKVHGHIVRLTIPAEAKRTGSLIGRKCRAEWVICEEIEGAKAVITRHETIYEVGRKIVSDKYDDDPRVECTHGIHFFLTRAEAEEWI